MTADRSSDCGVAAEDLLARIRGETSPVDGTVAEHMASCPTCRREAEGIRALMSALESWRIPEPSPAALRALRERIDRPPIPGPRLIAGLALAAALLLSLLFFLLPATSKSPSRLRLVTGRIAVAGRTLGDGMGSPLAPGRTISASALSRLTLNGARIVDMTLAAGTRIRFDGAREISLLRGELLAHVLPGKGAVRFRSSMGTAIITGTLFDLRQTAAGARLAVLDGTVVLRRKGGTTTIPAGRAAAVSGDDRIVTTTVDPWRVRDWCSRPTPVLDVHASRLVFILRNDTVAPMIVKPFDPSAAVYSLRIEGADGRIRQVKIQGGMLYERASQTDSRARVIEPGGSYRLSIDVRRLGLPSGRYRISAEYEPYTDDLPATAWRGSLSSAARTVEVP